MYHLRRFVIAVLVVVVCWVGLDSLHRHLDPNKQKTEEEKEDARWIATSKYFLDRAACRWIGICGIAHYQPDPPGRRWTNSRNPRRDRVLLMTAEDEDEFAEYIPWDGITGDGRNMSPDDWEGDERVLKDVPQFVLDHAPLVHLYSGEQFWPSDIAEHLMHTDPHQNHTSLHMNNSQHNVYNLHQLNEGRRGKYLFMRSKDDVEERPDWLGSAYNKPVPYGDEDEEGDEEASLNIKFAPAEISEYDRETWWEADGPHRKVAEPLASSFRSQPSRGSRSGLNRRRQAKRSPGMPDQAGYSKAPAILVLVNKGHGILDAFWFYFYSYNLGTTVFNIRFGNHVGDWEHSLVRFYNGVPKAVFFSAHSGGLAYSYDAVEKGRGEGREGRPVLYSAMGSHAMYPTPGKHPYILPFGLLADVTDKGPLWDPSLNYLAYYFNTSITHNQDAKSIPTSGAVKILADTLQPAKQNPKAPMGWWWYNGHWGDKFYELRDLRQWRFVGQYHYVNGPFGPRFKNLGRSRVCQSTGSCTILESLEGGKGRSWVGRRRRR